MNIHNSVKLEFFIGGTKHDLARAREKLIEAVLEVKHIPSGMELWASGVDPLLEDIEYHLQGCDVHIIILGARYGEIIDGKDLSYTEWEYNLSNKKRPILAFVLSDEDYKIERERQIRLDPDEIERSEKLELFRKELTKDRFCRNFSNSKSGIEELGRQCVNAIVHLINAQSLPLEAGWIRSSSEEALALRQIHENEFLKRELDRVQEFSVLGERVNLERVSKQTLATIFWQVMMGRIRRHGYQNIFFESGSTMVNVSYQFEKLVLKNKHDISNWRAQTNNVVILLQLLLYTDLDIKRFPDSAPDPKDKYGAIFPSEWGELSEPAPAEPRKLHDNEHEAVEKITKQVHKFGKKALLLTTISGWDLDHSINGFRGPHIGSHPNMLFSA